MTIEGIPFRDGTRSRNVAWARSSNGKTIALIFWPSEADNYAGKLLICAPRYGRDGALVSKLERATNLPAIVSTNRNRKRA